MSTQTGVVTFTLSDGSKVTAESAPFEVTAATPSWPGFLYGGSARNANMTQAQSFNALEADLKAASGQNVRHLQFHHTYDGASSNTIATSIPSFWVSSGLKYGLMNAKGSLTGTIPTGNLVSLAKSLPAGFTLYLVGWHEPEDNTNPAAFWAWFERFVRAVWAIPASNFAAGASIVPVFNMHGRLFDGRSAWGVPASWAPPAGMFTAAEKARIVGTINGYKLASAPAKYDTPAEILGAGFDGLRSWGFDQIGVCEMGSADNDFAAYIDACIPLFIEEQLVFATYFIDTIENNDISGWKPQGPAQMAALARLALAGRRP